MWGHTSAASCTCHDDIAYISLRLTFGGSLFPPLWCSMSKIITDLANDILASADWDPSKTHIPHCAQIPEPDFLADNIPFAQALPANVSVNSLIHGKVNCYVDNFIPIVLHSGNNVERSANTIPLNMHTIGRPVHPNEPISWEYHLCFCKLFCEG